MYYDKNNNPINIGDTLYFEEIGLFKLIMQGNLVLERCDDKTFPHLILKKIIVDNKVNSAYIVDKHWKKLQFVLSFYRGVIYEYLW